MKRRRWTVQERLNFIREADQYPGSQKEFCSGKVTTRALRKWRKMYGHLLTGERNENSVNTAERNEKNLPVPPSNKGTPKKHLVWDQQDSVEQAPTPFTCPVCGCMDQGGQQNPESKPDRRQLRYKLTEAQMAVALERQLNLTNLYSPNKPRWQGQQTFLLC